MIFWDTSAIVPLLVPEAASVVWTGVLAGDAEIAVSALTVVEIESALQRKRREGTLDTASLQQIRVLVAQLQQSWTEVPLNAAVLASALQLLAKYPLRSSDAMPLAGALALRSGSQPMVAFACADARLRQAALGEGFILLI